MAKNSAVLALLAVSAATMAAALTTAQRAGSQDHGQEPAGLFLHSTDIGLIQPGSTKWNPATRTYDITGGGADLWGATDAFRFAWTRISGDGAITAKIHFRTQSDQPNAKAVLMFRQSLDPGSAYADVALHADGHVTLQWRRSQGGVTEDATAPHPGDTIRIVRHGEQFTASTQGDGPMDSFAHIDIPLHDPVYAGVGVCAHDAGGLITVTFSKVDVSGSTLPQ